MNWAHVLLAGYIGAVIAIIVGVFRKKGWIGKVAGGVIFCRCNCWLEPVRRALPDPA